MEGKKPLVKERMTRREMRFQGLCIGCGSQESTYITGQEWSRVRCGSERGAGRGCATREWDCPD